jgi:hypothetical protein
VGRSKEDALTLFFTVPDQNGIFAKAALKRWGGSQNGSLSSRLF